MEKINAMLGNWKNYPEDQIGYKYKVTMNKGFFSSLSYIIQVLPYLHHKYFSKNFLLNICYYSHTYGSFPNYNIIGNYLLLNYEPNFIPIEQINKIDKDELIDLYKLCFNISGEIIEPNSDRYSFKNNFKLANKYFKLYFRFSDDIIIKKEKILEEFNEGKTLGIQLRGTDKLKVDFSQNIPDSEIVKVIDYELSKQTFSNIYIATDSLEYINLIKEKYSKNYKIVYLKMERNSINKSGIHFNNFEKIQTLINYYKNTKTKEIENKLIECSKTNEKLLLNTILDCLILAECNLVLETQSQLAAFSKVINPELEIYRLNSLKYNYWPDSYIPLYHFKDKTFDLEKYQTLELSWDLKMNLKDPPEIN